MTPKRIQMTRNKPWRCEAPEAVKVDRSTKWGNPFRIGDDMPGAPGVPMDAEDVCQCFELLTIPTLPVHELTDKDLACWCAPGAPCHADVLLKYANRCAGQSSADGEM
ncbi:hypothetical protein FIV00_15000 [Labrenzia sp. THAF82]|uniref:DUF4326 domain-containing protein n=1 Tax=Labrenzia sp. THAF82 TaxID=2587861 RepID=UPI001267C570|nr:DUF4326 domain-containing protein [Labrenzia sp. THAF82]QFT31798.1 hypothetical protein FIV00_15000 [Labrenzia sp. THAF82]